MFRIVSPKLLSGKISIDVGFNESAIFEETFCAKSWISFGIAFSDSTTCFGIIRVWPFEIAFTLRTAIAL